ncbi:MAG: AAA family ATPase [Acidimicrobiales bacterium]|nr:AAA family ATPase [Acidimicrobiales bacterium]MBO0893342.1 AAA family ATPase [Acidimicrobiales bacterium]
MRGRGGGRRLIIETNVVSEALAVAVAAGVPVVLWGSPGTGKTSAVRALGEGLGWRVEVVIGSIREPADFAGLPVVAGGEVRLAPPTWAVRLGQCDTGLLFLDELTTSPPAVQAAMLRVVLERVVGDLMLPPGIRVVAAANPAEQAADGWELSPPLANRLVHLDWPVEAKAIANGLAVGFPPPATLLPEEPTPAQMAGARAAVAAFLQVRPALVLQVPSAAALSSRGWPSPRSWEAVAVLLAFCEASQASEDARAVLVVGAVGEGPALEFLAWLANADLPDPEKALADPESFVLPDRSDRAFAALTAVASVAVSNGDAGSWAAAWRVVAKAAERAPDVAALVARTLAGARPPGAELPSEVLALSPVLRAAGLMRGSD